MGARKAPTPPPKRVGRIEQLTREVRYDLEARHGFFATLSPEFEERVEKEVGRRLADQVDPLTPLDRVTIRNAAIGAPPETQRLVRIIERLTGESFLP